MAAPIDFDKAPERIFVVWDTRTRTLRSQLDWLRREHPKRFDVPCLVPKVGPICENVMGGILEADGILVIIDAPNANVGFELGVALAVAPRICVAYHSKERPKISNLVPFAGFSVVQFLSMEQLLETLDQRSAWYPLARTEPVPANGRTLFLCPAGSEGGSCRKTAADLHLGLSYPQTSGFTLEEIPKLFREVSRLIWTITDYAEGLDERHGYENMFHAILAGWQYGRAECRTSGGEAKKSVFVLRSVDAPPIADVQGIETTFAGLEARRGARRFSTPAAPYDPPDNCRTEAMPAS
jgi:hypothetical protein